MAKKKKKKKAEKIPEIQWELAKNNALAVSKFLEKRIKRSVPKGFQYDHVNNIEYNNIVYPRDKIPDRLLRLVEGRNAVVGSVITLRIQQGHEYSNISHSKDVPGWEFVLKDKDATLTPELKKQKEFFENFLLNLGINNDPFKVLKRDTFKTLLTKFIRDRLLIDKVVWEIERDVLGRSLALWPLDGATIIPVLPGGYVGSTSQIAAGLHVGNNKFVRMMNDARVENIPPTEEISYVQELIYGGGGGLVAAFRETDVVYDIANERNDIRYYKQGYSVTEKANTVITAFINSLTYNSNGLSRGAIPKIAVAMGKDSNFTPEQLEDAQDEWMANFEAMDGQWNIPLLRGDAKILNLLPNNRDMEYQKFMEFSGSLVAGCMGADLAEVGLRFNQAQNVLNENQDAKQQFSKNRGLAELLGGFSYMVNRWAEMSGFDFAKYFKFRFNALVTEDKSYEADLRKKEVTTRKMVDEIRADDDLSPLPDGLGQVILDSVWLQNKQAIEAQQQGQPGEEGEYDEEDMGDFETEIDDTIDEELNKADILLI
jgi:hypothetical protein